MTESDGNLRTVWTSLWLRLIAVGVIALLFAATPQFPAEIARWRYYQTVGEILFELAARVVFVALAGVALGTVCTVVTTPFLILWSSSSGRIAQLVTRIAVATAAFFDLLIVAKLLIAPLATWAGLRWFPTLAVYSVLFAAALLIPRRRKQIVTSLDGFLVEKTTRRAAIATGLASAGLVAAEWTMGKVGAAGRGSKIASRRTGPNILLVTFDALSAEDMSLYGYRLPTTPHINRFADKGSVFTSFYSASTFTTSSVATILSGLYPSENHVYHLQGRLNHEDGLKTLPHLLRAGGYSTGASISNPFAYFVADGIRADYDAIRSPPYRTAGFDLWRFTGILHQSQPYGSRAREFMDLEEIRDYLPEHLESYSPRMFARTESGFSPGESFSQAREVLDQLPDGFFMWVHVMAPHGPYLPDAPWLGRFLPRGEMMSRTEQESIPPYYRPEMQYLIDKARLRYDEFVQECDNSFGSFLAGLEAAGRLRNTAVMVAADHGESFQGSRYMHASRWQTHPEIHIPLIIRMPGQQYSRRIGVTADQTALAPTILDIAGLPRPASMRGQSLLPLLNSDHGGEGEGLAFTQYLQTDSMFEPLRSGTVGVTDGQHQYVLNLATGEGILRGIDNSTRCDLDSSKDNPALAQTLRQALYSRFPNLPHKQA